jgi:hypothetical protein
MGEILIYQSEDGETKLDVTLEDETLWLSIDQISDLFQKSRSTINEHILNIYKEGELEKDESMRKIGNSDFSTKPTNFYNLDVIISVGYRVKSLQGTKFRKWATARIKEYIIKGFVMDDERLKSPSVGDSKVPDYFDEMLERIRDIRASERRVYLRVREIFKFASDYEPSLKETTRFFQHIQNKLHFAVTKLTAAEIISQRADSSKINMGITTLDKDSIKSTDVTIAKNYLSEQEIDELNRIVVMWLDYAEDQAKRRKQIFLKNWEEKLNSFLEFNERDVLENFGNISKKEADQKAKDEYKEFSKERRKEREEIGDRENIKALESIAKSLEGK